jgi:hypothetical protein
MTKTANARNVHFSKKSGTYMTSIYSKYGDLWQEYIGDANENAEITPNWTDYEDSKKPVLEFICMSSRTAVGELSILDSQITWYMNDIAITFSGGKSTGTFAGLFEKTVSNGRQALKIMKNLVVVAGFSSITIKAVATIIVGNSSDQLQATCPISVSQKSGNSYRVTISSGDDYNFVLTANNSTCKLAAKVYFNGALDETSSYTYKWYKLTGTEWEQITGIASTASTITVSKDDVNTYAEYKVEVYASDGTEPLGSDTQGVTDVTDPYMVEPCPTPTDETIEEGTSGSVVYEPKIVNRSGVRVSPTPLFDFLAQDTYGNYLGSASGASKFEVTEAMCAESGGDVVVLMTSEEF